MKGELTPAGVIATELVLEIFRVNGLFLEVGDDLTRPVGLTSARWQVLGAVEQRPEPVNRIARVMGLSRQAVQQTTDALKRDGFIEYHENPHHSRAKLVTLTPKARDALRFINKRQIQWANELGETHSAKQLQEALTLLRQLSQGFERDDAAAATADKSGKEVLV